MRPRIAIPMPHSRDRKYGERAIPQYERAVALVGGEPVRFLLDQGTAQIKNLAHSCDGVLLPGSNADVDPARFSEARSTRTAAADGLREDADFLLLENAYAERKPVLCICYGLQSLNVFRGGSLVQHIPDFLPKETRAKVNHEAGGKVAVAHQVTIDRDSNLAKICFSNGQGPAPEVPSGALPVNSSHHQSAHRVGKGLRVVAHCPDDGIIEALEGTSPDHFVVAVQWHPERSATDDEVSRAIFQALIDAAGRR